MSQDVFKILKDLELKAVGLDPTTNKMQEGYFISFRSIGLPIHKEDFERPWSPLGGNLAQNLDKDVPKSDPVDPKDAPKTASGQLDDNKVLTASIAQSQKNYLNTFMLVDRKLKMNSEYMEMPSSSTVSDTWYAIITGANGIPTDSVINDDLKKAYEAAAAKVMDKDGNPTPHYQAYMQYEDEWKSKVKAWHKAYSDAFTNPMKLQNWPIDGTLYQDDADQAMDRWVSFGFKEEIENAIATLAAQGTDPAIALISRAKKRFINSLNEFMSIGELPYTFMLPGSWYDKDNDDGWNIYTSDDLHSESHYNESSTSYGGGGGFNIGLWSAGADFEHSQTRTNLNFKTDNLDIEFSYCSVDVIRPWLVASLLNLKNWFLMGDYKKNCISTGQMGQELPNRESEPTFLPSIVTSLVLIKDLKIKWGSWESDQSSFEESTSASAYVGWGPFRVRGHYDHHGKQQDFECNISSEGIEVPGIQLIGYVSEIVPPCPAVDSSAYLKKPSTQSATTAPIKPA